MSAQHHITPKNDVIERAHAADTVIASMSGGKDSVAMWLYLEREIGLKNVQCVFADTGWESREMAGYLTYLRAMGCPLVELPQREVRDLWKKEPSEDATRRLAAAGISITDPLTMETLAAAKGRFPSSQARFCTTELKLIPLHLYRQSVEGDVLMCSGVRAQESPRRAAMADYMEDEFMGCDHWKPIFHWTHDEVFELHHKHGINPNPLYKKGQHRVGCWPCIHARKGDIADMVRHDPARAVEIAETEKRVAKSCNRGMSSFFVAEKAAKGYRNREIGGVQFADFEGVAKWAIEAPTPFTSEDLFSDEDLESGVDLDAPACQSPYGLCGG